jgi:hypothetical protein
MAAVGGLQFDVEAGLGLSTPSYGDLHQKQPSPRSEKHASVLLVHTFKRCVFDAFQSLPLKVACPGFLVIRALIASWLAFLIRPFYADTSSRGLQKPGLIARDGRFPRRCCWVKCNEKTLGVISKDGTKYAISDDCVELFIVFFDHLSVKMRRMGGVGYFPKRLLGHLFNPGNICQMLDIETRVVIECDRNLVGRSRSIEPLSLDGQKEFVLGYIEKKFVLGINSKSAY